MVSEDWLGVNKITTSQAPIFNVKVCIYLVIKNISVVRRGFVVVLWNRKNNNSSYTVFALTHLPEAQDK